MLPPFGFSVGDFIAAIGLIAKVSKAVRDKAGASNEYQHVLLELQALDKTLRYLQALQPRESNADHVNAIRGMALTCRIPLQEFLDKIRKFEASLGPFATHNRGCLKSMGRKSQWTVFMSEEVAKLRTVIGAKVLSINLLLATHTSESLSRIEAEAHKSHVALLASIVEQRTSMAKMDKKIDKTKSSIRDDLQRQSEKTDKIANHIDNAAKTLRHVSDTTDAVNTAVTSFRTLATQLLQTIHHLPSHIRESLEQVVRSNMQMYTMLRAIHSSILRAPVFQPEDSVRFEDVLGRTKLLPYEYFRHFEVFNSYLQTQFKGLPGEQKVLQRQFLILDTHWNASPISEEQWGNMVFPGSSLVMSILVEHLGAQASGNWCPRMGCNGLGVSKDPLAFKSCDKCGMEFAAPQSANLFYPKRKLDWLSEPRHGTNRPSHSNKPRGNGYSPIIQPSKRGGPPEEDLEESEFWEKHLEPSEQTERDLRVFRRVHLQALSPLMQSLHGIDKSYFQAFDIKHVREKFPDAPYYLAERLGKAISRRRQYLSYREKHRQLLSHEIDTHAECEETKHVERADSKVSTAATRFDLETGMRDPLHVKNDEDTVPRTSYTASSLWRHAPLDAVAAYGQPRVTEWGGMEFRSHRPDTRFEVSSQHASPYLGHHESYPTDLKGLRQIPTAVNHKEPCPICFRLMSFRRKHEWKEHIWRDLHPYLCTFDGCDTANRIYQSSHAWFEHEVEAHYPDTDINLPTTCLLCGDELSRFANLRSHMGRHQEQLASFALPVSLRVREDFDDAEDLASQVHDNFDDTENTESQGSDNSDDIEDIESQDPNDSDNLDDGDDERGF